MQTDAIRETNFNFPGQSKYYEGKVREVYTINEELLVMIVSDRISAFDVVLPKAIPFLRAVNETRAMLIGSMVLLL